MKTLSAWTLGFLTVVLAACGGPSAKNATSLDDRDLPLSLAAAFREEATGDPVAAVELYARALARAASSPEDSVSTTVAAAALDALVHREISGLSEFASVSALSERVSPKRLRHAGGTIEERLAKISEVATGPFVPALIANARRVLAERRGDAEHAATFRALQGCAREAVMFGPVSWLNTVGVGELPLSGPKPESPMPRSVPSPGPIHIDLKPFSVQAQGCRLPLSSETNVPGVRELIVDIEVPTEGMIGVGLRASAPTVLRAAGSIALARPSAMGSSTSLSLAKLQTSAGSLRVIVRAAMEHDLASIELGAWNESGAPLRMRVPSTGSVATARVRSAVPVTLPLPRTNAERLAFALGALANGDALSAEEQLAPLVASKDAPPELLLAYARAVKHALDLPTVNAHERARQAFERVLEAWPRAWEAALEHAALAGARRSPAEANLEALSDLASTHARPAAPASALLDVFEAQLAGRERLYDRARAAFLRAKKSELEGTTLLAETERVIAERTGRERVAFECGHGPTDRRSLACHAALVLSGDRVNAERELERLRALAGAPQLYRAFSLRSALASGELEHAEAIWSSMLPGERSLDATYGVKGKASLEELLAMAPRARDALTSLPGILRDAGDDPLAAYEGLAEKAVATPSHSTGAATEILMHRERYEVSPSGLVHFTLFDVRRVMGTTDVEANAQAGAPSLLGRASARILRRRIFKRDGRIVLPDPTPNAAQSYAELSQLEAGDAIEAIYEGWALPSGDGNVGIDTPDLMPERTAVREAQIEFVLPKAMTGSFWSHPLLGKAEPHADETEGASRTGRTGQRTFLWQLRDRSVRRLEPGTAKMDRAVAVRFATTSWASLGRILHESLTAISTPSIEVERWARDAANGATSNTDIVKRVVAASGKAVKEASGAMLADLELPRGLAQGMTARSILTRHEGSRTWLVTHALRTLGIATDIVLAEEEPFSESPDCPPHAGHFVHPLAVAHVTEAAGDASRDTKNVGIWIDADIPGPPLPAGRISPELRGRSALHADGTISPLPTSLGDVERDEVDIRLVVDDNGDAKGTITALLRGRAAQDLSEALARLVGLERQRALRGIALGWLPASTVESVELSSSEESGHLAIRAEVSIPGYAKPEGRTPTERAWRLPGLEPMHHVFPRPFATTLSATYARQAERESSLAVSMASQYHVRRRVELPGGTNITTLPMPFDAVVPLVRASRKLSVTGTVVDDDFTLEVTTGTVARDGYEAFVTALRRTDDAFRASIRVHPATK
jgi:hypothetical protein